MGGGRPWWGLGRGHRIADYDAAFAADRAIDRQVLFRLAHERAHDGAVARQVRLGPGGHDATRAAHDGRDAGGAEADFAADPVKFNRLCLGFVVCDQEIRAEAPDINRLLGQKCLHVAQQDGTGRQGRAGMFLRLSFDANFD